MSSASRSSLRGAVERRSVPVLAVLARQPRVLPALAVAALFAGLLLLPPPGAAGCLVVLAGLLAWLGYLSWPALQPGARLVRVAVLLGLAVLGVWRIVA